MSNRREAECRYVEDEVERGYKTVQQKARHLLPFQPQGLSGDEAHDRYKQRSNCQPPESNFKRSERLRPAYKNGAGREEEDSAAHVEKSMPKLCAGLRRGCWYVLITINSF